MEEIFQTKSYTKTHQQFLRRLSENCAMKCFSIIISVLFIQKLLLPFSYNLNSFLHLYENHIIKKKHTKKVSATYNDTLLVYFLTFFLFLFLLMYERKAKCNNRKRQSQEQEPISYYILFSAVVSFSDRNEEHH